MKLFLNIFLAISLVAFAGAAPTGEDELVPYNLTSFADIGAANIDDSPTRVHHGYATAEVWIGRQAINVGDVRSTDMYTTMYKSLDRTCPDKLRGFCSSTEGVTNIPTHYVKKTNGAFPIELGDTYFGYIVQWAEWESEQIRRLLLTSVASVLEGLTRENFAKNCYWSNAPGAQYLCNGPNFINVNLPDKNGKKNFIHVTLYGDKVYSTFKCCPTRKDVDISLDIYGKEMSQVFDQAWRRSVSCLIDGWTTCEDCGHKCDACGPVCAK